MPDQAIGQLTLPRERKFAKNSTSESVLEENHAYSATLAGTQAVLDHIPPKPAPCPASPPTLELKRAHTPLRLSQIEKELCNHPNKTWTKWLLQALYDGVPVGYTGPRNERISPNLHSALLNPAVIDKQLHEEVSRRRILGPFSKLPLKNLQCSGLGAVPKKGSDKWRVIMHLSAPHGQSINDYISKEEYTLHYSTIDDAVNLLSHFGPSALMAKVDLKSAFRIIPVARQDWELLGLFWRGNYYIDTCLPFGLRSAPFLFNQFADALHWILAHNYNLHLIHYLDDYFIVGPPQSQTCQAAVQTMLNLCTRLGIPIALDKLEGPDTAITFLGIEIDSKSQEIRLPAGKLHKLLQDISMWKGKKKAKKRELLSIIGSLSFATKVVPAGRLFLRRLIDLSSKVKQLHHYVSLNAEARADFQWWIDFLPSWNGKSMFLNTTWTSAEDLELYTDASGTHGYGAFFKGAWFNASWLPNQISRSIQWKELFAILAAATTWAKELKNLRITFFCDNQAIVHTWQNKSSKHPAISDLLRRLFFVAATHNFSVSMSHLPGCHNKIADALSRHKLTEFFTLVPQAEPHPTQIPPELDDI